MPDMHGNGFWFVLFYLEIVLRNWLAFCIQAVQSELCHNKVAETSIFREMHNFVTFVYPANNASSLNLCVSVIKLENKGRAMITDIRSLARLIVGVID